MKNRILKKISRIIGSKKSIIMAGHFPTINEGNKVFAGVYEDIPRVYENAYFKAKRHPYMAKFPLETFKAGVHLLNKQSRIMLLVNDHQFIDTILISDERNPWREEFFKEDKIPAVYENILKIANLKDPIWKPPNHLTFNNSKKFISEYKLRKKFRQAKYKSCSLESGCAQEFYPLLEEIYHSDFEIMVNFIPLICAEPIMEATEEFRNSITQKGLDVVNIFLNGGLQKKRDMWSNSEIFLNENKIIF